MSFSILIYTVNVLFIALCTFCLKDSCVSSCWNSRLKRSSAAHKGDPLSSSGSDQVLDVPAWTAQQVADWLTCQNLSQYAGGFLEKQISGRVLLDLDSAKMKVDPRQNIRSAFVSGCVVAVKHFI